MAEPKAPVEVVDEAARNALFARPAAPRTGGTGGSGGGAASRPESLVAAQSSGSSSNLAPSAAGAAAAAGATAGTGPASLRAVQSDSGASSTSTSKTDKKLFNLGSELFKPKSDIFKKKPNGGAVQRSGSGSLVPRREDAGDAAAASGQSGAGASTGASTSDDTNRSELLAREQSAARHDLFLSDDEGDDAAAEDADPEAALDAVLREVLDTGGDEGIDEVDALLSGRIEDVQEDPLVRNALEKGLDLREYAKTIERELVQVERASVDDYINQSPQLEALHSQIQACDQILATMEQMLGGFQSDLHSISSEIQTLQQRSLAMNIKLRNRKTVKVFLGNFLEEIVIPPALVRGIMENEVNEAYLPYLTALSRKLAFVREKEGQNMPAVEQLVPEVERLRLKAVEKVRECLLELIRNMKKPRQNLAQYQSNTLLKYRLLNAFLLEQHPSAAADVHNHYVAIMRDFYQRQFARYSQQLSKLIAPTANKYDLLGSPETISSARLFGARISLKERGDIFRLGDRGSILGQVGTAGLVASVLEQTDKRFPFEVILRSMEQELMDNSCSEYTFITEFFNVRGDTANTLFLAIFDGALDVALKLINEYLETTFDTIGLLLCIRLNFLHQRRMQANRVPCLDTHLNSLLLLFWPKLQMTMDRHINSIKTATPASLAPVDKLPHYVTKRFADFVMAISVMNEGHDDPPINNGMSRLRLEFEVLVGRMAGEFQDKRNGSLVFLINQYDHIVNTLNAPEGATAVELEREHWLGLCNARMTEFAELELETTFASLVRFVRSTDNMTDMKDLEISALERVVVDFGGTWKQTLVGINGRVGKLFATPVCSQAVLHLVMKQLLLYYSRFVVVVEKRFGRNQRLPFQEEMVDLEKVRFEIKKYRPQA